MSILVGSDITITENVVVLFPKLFIDTNETISLSENNSVSILLLVNGIETVIGLTDNLFVNPIVLPVLGTDNTPLIEYVEHRANKLLLSASESLTIDDAYIFVGISIAAMLAPTPIPIVIIGIPVRRGRVVLDGVTFLTDPRDYKPLDWEKRSSVFQGISGTVTVQDFGVFQKDNKIILRSGGDQGVIDGLAAHQIHQMYRTRGGVFSFSDWLGNSFKVAILMFKAWPLLVVNDPLYEYELSLQVIQINTLFSYAYTGS